MNEEMVSDTEKIEWYKKHHKGYAPSSRPLKSFFTFPCDCCGEEIEKGEAFYFIGARGDSDKICISCADVIRELFTNPQLKAGHVKFF